MKSEGFSKITIYFLVACLCLKGLFFDLGALANEGQSEEHDNESVIIETEKEKCSDKSEEIMSDGDDESILEEDKVKEEDEKGEDNISEEVLMEPEGVVVDERDDSSKLKVDELEVQTSEAGDSKIESEEGIFLKGSSAPSSVVVGDNLEEDFGNEEKEASNESEDPSGAGVIINEVMIAQTISSKNEFIELFNSSKKTVNLDDWKLTKKTASGNESNLISTSKFSGEIKAGEFFVIKHPSFDALEKYNALYSGSSYSIAKDNSIILYNSEGDVVDSLCWGSRRYECEGVSFSENPGSGFSLARKKYSSNEFLITREVTPGGENIFPEKEVFSKLVSFSEIVPNPEGVDKDNEWVEIVSGDSNSIDLSGWSIMNGSGKVFRISSGTIEGFGFFVVGIEGAGSFSIRNSNEQLFLLNPNMEKVASVLISGSARSGLSYNSRSDGWRWSKYLTLGKANSFNVQPQISIKKVKKVYKNIYAEFDASKTKDANGENLKFKWDFGDGHYSYLKKTKHKYKKKGKYKVVLEVDDGTERVSREIKIEVKSFPRRELRIVRLLPNPKGKDSGNEVISIHNYYKKKLNLEGYKLATGRDRDHLVNHPIYEDFKIKSGKSKDLKNKQICRFSLLNKKGVVALLYPNGKIADIVSYEKGKIADGEEYVLQNDESNQWSWVGLKGEDMNTVVDVGAVVPKGVSSALKETKKTFHFISATRNDKELICECVKKLRIENWKHQNKKISMLLLNPNDIALFKVQ